MQCFTLCLLALLWAAASRAETVVTGRVLDETGAAIAGARVELQTPGHDRVAAASTDAAGAFQLTLPAPGEYRVHATRQGFFVLNGEVRSFGPGALSLTVTLHHAKELAESIDVTYSPPAIDLQEPAEHKELDNIQIQSVPYPAPQDFRNALPLLNGAIQDNTGRLHMNGGGSEQTNYSFDGFHISDPVTGRLEARLNIDSVRSLDAESSRISAERGRGSAGAVDVKTKMGDDRFRFGGTNFIPGLSTDQGLHVNKWTPRLEASGPIARSRAWFYNGFDAFYDLDTVNSLPRGENRSRGLTASNLTRVQVNLTPANILSASFLFNYSDRDRYGLDLLHPSETTTSRRGEMYFTSIRDQHYFKGGALADIGFADTRGVLRDTPQGSDLFEITPNGNRGNYFVNLERHYSRRQLQSNLFLPVVRARGTHRFKFGVDFERESFHQSAARHAYQVLRVDNSVARYVTFSGSPFQGQTNFTGAEYAQDQWTPREGVLIDAGLRTAWNQVARTLLWEPRLAAVWAPGRLRDTKLSAGFGVFHDAITLGAIAAQDQISLSTFYTPSGAPAYGPVPTAFAVDDHQLRTPRYLNFSLAVERKLPAGFYGKAGFLHRSGGQGFAYVPPVPDIATLLEQGAIYQLYNLRRDRYDALELSVRRTFAGQFEWFAGYTRSAARTNAVVDYSLENPIFAPQMSGPYPWDAPDRLLTWGWTPIPKRLLPARLAFLSRETSVAYLLEYRTGFPFGVVNEEGVLVGRMNELRLPDYFNINLHFERRFRALRYLWAWRFGFNNLTNNGNPNAVNNNIDSPFYLTYGRGQSRAFSVRLRFLGRR
jgi:hypothetical protein